MKNYQCGDIIYHDDLIFLDGVKDNKKMRPCIVLFSEDRKDNTYVYSVPLTSQLETFNKQPKKHVLIPEVVYRNRCFSFAKVSDVVCCPVDKVNSTGIKLDKNTIQSVIRKVYSVHVRKNKINYYKHLKKMLIYDKLFDEIDIREEKKERKRQKVLRRRMQKNK